MKSDAWSSNPTVPSVCGDTIAAISTPLGEGGIGIVRVSGPDAVAIVDATFSASDRRALVRAETHTVRHGFVVDRGRRVDEVLVTVMRAPRTYTREDVVEVNCHGGIVATRRVLEVILAGGARLAERGEFTRRAFENGRLSLDEAKSVLDVVRARSGMGLEAALAQLGGGFAEEIDALRRRLAEVRARIELGVDFPDDDTSLPVSTEELGRLAEEIDVLLRRGARGRALREGLTVCIAGRPNVGKSTLLNRLLDASRAIVAPLPGTTRDTVEGETVLDGIPVRLIDTAGLRETDSAVESEGVRRAERAILASDLVLLVVDRSVPADAETHRLLERRWDRPVALVWSKADLPSHAEQAVAAGPWVATFTVSALCGTGMDDLRKGVLRLLRKGELPQRQAVLLLDTWQVELLRRVRSLVGAARTRVDEGAPVDQIAEELRWAHVEAGRLQGIDLDEEVLDRLFTRFCVGK